MTDDKFKVVQNYEYDSFGNQHDMKNRIKQPYGYTGREHDRETGLRYYRARYYDGEVGVFLSKDPLGIESSELNFYSYVGNDPVNNIDPTGMEPNLWMWPFNGNLIPGYEDQDDVCSPPAQSLNDNECMKKSCQEHDRCYKQYGCNASSWLRVAFIGPCQVCNMKATICILSELNEQDCGECDDE